MAPKLLFSQNHYFTFPAYTASRPWRTDLIKTWIVCLIFTSAWYKFLFTNLTAFSGLKYNFILVHKFYQFFKFLVFGLHRKSPSVSFFYAFCNGKTEVPLMYPFARPLLIYVLFGQPCESCFSSSVVWLNYSNNNNNMYSLLLSILGKAVRNALLNI